LKFKTPAIRVPLYLRFLGWAGLNLLIIAASFYFYAPHDETGLNLFLTQSVRERLTSIAREIADDVYGVDPSLWAPILARHQNIFGVEFLARAAPEPPRDGQPPGVAGALPPVNRPGPPNRLRRDQLPPDLGPPNDFAPGPPGLGQGPPATINIGRRSQGGGYDITIFIEAMRLGGPPRGYIVTAYAANGRALLGLLGIGSELRFGVMLLVLSALLWWPFIWRITRTIRRLSEATDLMSRGRLETRVVESRRDELGDLASAVNAMAARLELLVSGQRQFVADVAHEVISPIARMQIGLGILEGRLGEPVPARLNDLREDLDGMAGMLNELLLFSRAGMEAARSAPSSVELRALVGKVVANESGSADVVIDVPEALFVNVHTDLLSRALANLIRNAERYGGGATEPVQVTAVVDHHYVKIAVKDRGPGVPEAALARLGEPFFRPELSRTRATGGFGLGLAIVKRCILACDGDVSFNNRQGGGFEARVSVPIAER
jgi:two-component system sensor histidine kinase CpxA